MSKSKGNVVAPQTVMKELGADILRLWVASTDYRGEMAVSNEILTRTSDAYRRIRNTARFLLSNLADFDPDQMMVGHKHMLALDRWLLDRAFTLQEEIKSAYDTYQFQSIHQKILHFCVIDLGSFYLDIVKDRQYTGKTDSLPRRSAQTAMYHVLEALVRWLAPITSFTADEIWQYMPGQRSESVFLETWYRNLAQLDAESILSKEQWQTIMAARTAVSKELEKSRNKGDIGSSLNAEVELYCSSQYYETLSLLADELRFVFITSSASVMTEQFCPNDAVTTEINGIKIKVLVSEHKKCVRCWHQRYDVGDIPEHPELCGRCVENVIGDGENRKLA
jgi:isoleucyl-tRNA synthetase